MPSRSTAALRAEALDLLAKLVAFDSTMRNSNLPILDFIRDHLDRLGIASLRVDYEPGKANLYATIGPDTSGGVVLSGHTDVVPVDGQSWTSDPFALTERDGRVYGRGACDMKGFVACCLALAPHFAAKASALKRPIHLAFSCDEEVGCRGVRPLVAHIRDHLPLPAAVIVGEPTMMGLVDAHKTAISYETVVTGHEAHSSLAHEGVNAIMVAGEILAELNRIDAEMRERGDASGRFDPPWTSVHVGLIAGGTARNIVPKRCAFSWETRLLPDSDPDEVPVRLAAFCSGLERRMQAKFPETGIATRRLNAVPGLKPDPGSPAERLARLLTGANTATAVSYATEAGLFQEAGMSAIICGPGSIDQAHKPDEFVDIAQLEACAAMLGRLLDHLTEG
ncbi:MAG: acetylornithine deacetylase [Hyphomicrobiales bacterium]